MIAAATAAMASCGKDDEEKGLPSLAGALTFHAPEFIKPGQTVTMTPKGVAHPEDKGIGFYWYIQPIMDDNDTTRFENGLNIDGQESDGSLTYTFPDSLGVFTVHCFAYAEGFTGLSGDRYVTTVKPGLEGFRPTHHIRGTELLLQENRKPRLVQKQYCGKKFRYAICKCRCHDGCLRKVLQL